ncbi:hypothetical protein, partial [Mesorhizobium sp. M1A.F.Ca.IN.020.04.1.1]|uniref:hypothetical protein n=1 Tax=Mesorhizobium sp. M1A.F.Ca.IN.020.04.1.1 TaxID=2496761 RepID=UPI0019CFF6F3
MHEPTEAFDERGSKGFFAIVASSANRFMRNFVVRHFSLRLRGTISFSCDAHSGSACVADEWLGRANPKSAPWPTSTCPRVRDLRREFAAHIVCAAIRPVVNAIEIQPAASRP